MYQYSNAPEVNNVQEQGNYAPPPPLYYNPAAQGYAPVYPGMPGVVMQQPVQGNGKAAAGLVLGIIGMLAWLFPLVGYPISIVGLVLASKAKRVLPNRGIVKAGYVLCWIALGLTLGNSVLGILLMMH